jgi:hypothetical protein
MVRDKGFSHQNSKEAPQHRGQVKCAAGRGVCAVFGANCHAGAAIVNGPEGRIQPPAISPSEHILSEGGRATCSLSAYGMIDTIPTRAMGPAFRS